jgi:hypothetical protein
LPTNFFEQNLQAIFDPKRAEVANNFLRISDNFLSPKIFDGIHFRRFRNAAKACRCFAFATRNGRRSSPSNFSFLAVNFLKGVLTFSTFSEISFSMFDGGGSSTSGFEL